MRDIREINAANNTTKADIEGGSFQVIDAIHVPVTPGIVGEQIDSLDKTCLAWINDNADQCILRAGHEGPCSTE